MAPTKWEEEMLRALAEISLERRREMVRQIQEWRYGVQRALALWAFGAAISILVPLASGAVEAAWRAVAIGTIVLLAAIGIYHAHLAAKIIPLEYAEMMEWAEKVEQIGRANS